jgi:acetoin utilization deacetylase AcuC-like enzyme
VPAASGRDQRPAAGDRPGQTRWTASEAPQATLEQLELAHAACYVLERMDVMRDARGRRDPRGRPRYLGGHPAPGAALALGRRRGGRDRRRAVRAELENAFCAVRPPGHHATRDQAMGFCFFNNVAVAARHALDAHGLQRVAIVDFDVHHGNGTEDIIAGDERVLMVSFFQHPLYPFSGGAAEWAPTWSTCRCRPTRAGPQVRELIEMMWMPRLEEFRPQMIFISAGFDAHREDDMGQLGLVEADYEWITAGIKAWPSATLGAHRVLPRGRLQPERAGAQRRRASARAGRHVAAAWRW